MENKKNNLQNKKPPIKAARKNALQDALRKNLLRRKKTTKSTNDQS